MAVQPKTYVFDAFYRDADAVRALALRGSWMHADGGFCGQECEPVGLDIPSILDHIATLMGEALRYHRIAQGRFRSLTHAQEMQKVKQVHIDRNGFAGIICLNPIADGAALVVRHRTYGIAHLEDVECVASTIGATAAEVEGLIERDASDFGMWEVVERLEYRYNRLIIFDSNLYHVAAAGFGEELKNAKLTQNFTFTPKRLLRWWEHLTMRGRTKRALARNPY